MKKEYLKIGATPAIIWGEDSDKAYIYVHGKSGCKEEAEGFYGIVGELGWQVISVDLPEHGERSGEKDTFYPWIAVNELKDVAAYATNRYKRLSLMAGSIGAWFSMLAFKDMLFERCLFVSPILDMDRLIGNMMNWASVTREELNEKQTIQTDFGETLSWRYYCYALEHPIDKWDSSTYILYADKDNLTQRDTVDGFCERFGAKLTVLENGEHWFHTPEQVSFMHEWMKNSTVE